MLARPVSEGGLSSARVLRIDSAEGIFALKGWPCSVTLERLASIHAFQSHLSARLPGMVPELQFWPSRERLLEADGYRWELSTWMPGETLSGLGTISDAQLQSCMVVLGLLHRHAVDFEDPLFPGDRLRVSPGLEERRRGLEKLASEGNASLKYTGSLRLSEADQIDLKELELRARGWAPRLLVGMQTVAERPVNCCWILRDLWRAHWRFQGRRAIGVIDFGAARFDWPGLDLVRTLGTMLPSDDPRWEEALAQYSGQPGTVTMELDAVLGVHRASVVLAAMQWIDWIHRGAIDVTQRGSTAWGRIVELLEHLRAWE